MYFIVCDKGSLEGHTVLHKPQPIQAIEEAAKFSGNNLKFTVLL